MLLSKNILFLMKKSDISISVLAKSTDVPISTLHGWLQGIEPRSIAQVKSIADFFQVSIDELCFGDPETPIANLNSIVI